MKKSIGFLRWLLLSVLGVIAAGSATAQNPFQLAQPYLGTAQPETPLYVVDNENAKGSWTLTLVDVSAANTSTFVSWKLKVVAGAPYKT